MTAAPRIRPLEKGDVALAVALTNAEGWSFDGADIKRILGLGGGLLAEDDRGEAIGVLTLVRHANVAWIGNVIVPPRARGGGVGTALAAAAIEEAARTGHETVGLYSVVPAIPLYRRLGFRDFGDVQSLGGIAPGGAKRPPGVRAVERADLPNLAGFDAARFGDDRSRLLETLHGAYPDSFLVLDGEGEPRGYAIAKPASGGAEIGPLVTEAGDADAVAALLDAALASLPPGPVEAAVPTSNFGAMLAFTARGFKPRFPALAMYRGATGHEFDPFSIGAVGGLEKG